MSAIVPITAEAEICQVLTCLPEKFIVDFANGIDVVRDHTRVQRSRTQFFQRLYDGFSGKGVRRQNEINDSLADGVEASLKWLNQLSMSLAKTNFSVAQVNQRVAMIQSAVSQVADYSADTREQLIELSMNLDRRCNTLETELSRIDMVQRANDHMELVFSRWEAGKFQNLSISSRCYATLEELRWGSFGDFCRKSTATERSGHLERLMNRSMIQMSSDAKMKPNARGSVRDWLLAPESDDIGSDTVEAIKYLGDWAQADMQPFVYSASFAPSELPLRMPRICSAERIAQAMVVEVFDCETQE